MITLKNNNGKRGFVLLLLALLIMPCAEARQVSFNGKLKGNVPTGMRIYFMAAGVRQGGNDTLSYGSGNYSVSCASPSPYGFYKIMSVYHQRQNSTTLHLKDGAKAPVLRVDTLGVSIVKPDADNKVLQVFNDGYANLSKRLWMEGRDMTNDQLKDCVTAYERLADSIVAAAKPSADVAQYMRIWAATQTFAAVNSLKFATGHAPAELGINPHDEALRLLPVVDSPMSALFSDTHNIAIAAISGKSLTDRLESLAATVKDTALVRRAQSSMLHRWLSSFDYQNHFDEGLEELRSLTAKYHFDGKYVADFEAKRSTIKGTPFPAEAKLFDRDGKEVSFAQFKGKVVYVDLWASWCVPCIREVPHLKQLEKEFEGKSIAFVSISIDSNVDAWKRKSEQLDLHGNQFINSDNSLGKALNVNGIPRFLIYGADGNLVDGNAPRPSDTRTKPMLEKLCQ